LDNAYLYDIDGLQGVVDSNLEERRQAAEEAQKLVEDEVRAFSRWRQSQALTPMIVALRESLYGVGQQELERALRKLGPLNDKQQQAISELTRGVIQKILHRPIRHLRGAVDRGDLDDCLTLYSELFGVDRERAQRAEQVDPEREERVEGSPTSTTESPTEQDPPNPPRPQGGPHRILKGGKEG
jgi:glutamyl-tRNA reductase